MFEKPGNCPYCDRIIDAIDNDLKLVSLSEGYFIVIAHKCTSRDYIYSACYLYDKDIDKYKFINIYPGFREQQFSEQIKSVSPRFEKLYNQVFRAETSGDYELAGSGYRNAI